jgi:hypothetical protein
MNNKIDKILQSLNNDIKYYMKNKIFNDDYKDTIRTKTDLLQNKLSNEEIDRLYD